MRYLILGSSGQIGSALYDYLEKSGNTVLPFDIIDSDQEDLRVYNSRELYKRMRESDFVFFLAFDVGGARFLKTHQNTYDFLSNNIKIMNTTFDMLRKLNKKFIFSSSQMSNMSYSSYGTLKALGEHYTQVLNGIVVKFWNVYGIEHDLNKAHVITDFILKARDHHQIEMLTDGKEERQFLFSGDASEALYKLAINYKVIDRTEELHITSGKWTSISNVAKIVSKHFGHVEVMPGENRDEIQKFKKNEANTYIYKYWRPSTTLEDGIRKVVEHYKQSNSLKVRAEG